MQDPATSIMITEDDTCGTINKTASGIATGTVFVLATRETEAGSVAL